MTPDTYIDLFVGYGVVWGCIFCALCVFMSRGWKLEKRLHSLETLSDSQRAMK